LACLAVWSLAADAFRRAIPYFPTDKDSADAAAHFRGNAGIAASIGAVRGDLWASYAIALMSDTLIDLGAAHTAASPALAENTIATVITAAGVAPFDSRMWLLLAILDTRLNRNGSESLKMSYYTGPNEVALTPSRLLVATRMTAIADPELQILVGRELRMIVTHRPDLRPALFSAYRHASPDGRRFIEAEVGSLDPGLLGTLRAGGPAR